MSSYLTFFLSSATMWQRKYCYLYCYLFEKVSLSFSLSTFLSSLIPIITFFSVHVPKSLLLYTFIQQFQFLLSLHPYVPTHTCRNNPSPILVLVRFLILSYICLSFKCHWTSELHLQHRIRLKGDRGKTKHLIMSDSQWLYAKELVELTAN